MKKYIFLILATILFGASANARTCTRNTSDACSTDACPCCYTCSNCVGGCCIKANKTTADYEGCDAQTCNGYEFCKSNSTMTWWSAFTWCESNGRHLATFSEMCPGIIASLNSAEGSCRNLTNTTVAGVRVWTAYPRNSGEAFVTGLSSGAIASNIFNHPSYSYALCK